MKYAVDLHIHSALSPCADNDMTPNNIIGMALIKGLDIIAITDHNSAENLEAFEYCSKGTDLVFVPGMELETREEIHLICLFPTVQAALNMQNVAYTHMPLFKNREEIFGEQLILTWEDSIQSHLDRLLLTAADISLEDAVKYAYENGGIAIPAHIDRSSFSVISSLGRVPEETGFKFLEISRNCNLNNIINENDYLKNYNFIRSSDAHTLGDIFERESFLDLEEKSVRCLINALRGK